MVKIDMRKKQSPVQIIVENTWCKIDGLNSAVVFSALDRQLSYTVEGAEFTKAYRKGYWDAKKSKWVKWDGRQHLYKNGKFLTGLLKRAIGVLKNNNVEYTIVDQRVKPKSEKPIGIKKKIESREYQNRVMAAVKKNKVGIVSVATGGGKSILIARTISHFNVKTIVYVPGVDLLYQTRNAIQDALKGVRVGVLGDGIVDIEKITVCTIWTAVNMLGEKYVKVNDEDSGVKEKIDLGQKSKAKRAISEAELFVVDECQLLGTKTLQLINIASPKAFYKFGMSGTPYRSDNSDLLLEAICGHIIVEVTSSELIKKGFLVRPHIQMVEIPPYNGTLSDKYQSIYKEYIVENEVRNEKIAEIAEKLNEAGRKVLILVKNISHGATLVKMLPENLKIYFVRGSIDSDERNRIRAEFLDGSIDIIIASSVYDMGINIPNLDSLILAGGGRAKGRLIQRIGRVLRTHPGKDKAIVVDFIDQARYLNAHSQIRMNTYRSEVEFRLKLPKGTKSAKDKSKKTKTKHLPKNEGW